jgi:hypothetical protein
MRLVLLMACVCLLPHHVSAQQEPRVSIFAGVSAQPSDTSFTDVTHFPYNLESGLAEGDYAVQGGTGLDIGGRVHIWRQFGFVVSINRISRDTTTSNAFSFPHPLYFGADRQLTVARGGLDLKETVLNMAASYWLPTKAPLEVVVFGGPTYFKFSQGVVQSFAPTEAYPFDSISDVQLTTGVVDGSAFGFNAGAEVTWYFSRNFGAGGVVRVTEGTKTMSLGIGEPFDLSLGAIHLSTGIRMRF